MALSGQSSALRRAIGLPALVLYGLGTTIGAGIYALLGEVTAVSGALTPYAFLLAALLAAGTALSFAEFVQRYPTAGAAAFFVSQGLGSPRVGQLVGGLVATAGLVSAAALLNACVDYLQTFFTLSPAVLELSVLGALTAVCLWGIGQSVWLAGVICLLEIGGLLWMATLALLDTSPAPALGAATGLAAGAVVPPFSEIGGGAVLAGAVLAFYAFIGFEDMVEVAEEVRHVRRTLPLAIILTLLLTTALYLLLVVGALRSLGVAGLAGSAAPLAVLSQHLLGGEPRVITFIAVAAISNGVLIQMIMVSRVFYGLSSRGQAPAWLASVAERTQTPVAATLVAAAIILLLALSGSLGGLAQATSLLMLTVFFLVNVALFRLKRHALGEERGWLPIWVPVFGALACVLLIAASLFSLT
ncbi:MAG: APC family permease [Pseudomonadota bacterium]